MKNTRCFLLRRFLAILLCGFLVGGGSSLVSAEITSGRLALFSRNMELAGILDAYETFCDSPVSRPLRDRILAGAENEGATSAQIARLRDAGQVGHDTQMTLFQDMNPDCKDIDFLFEKYAHYQRLSEYISRLASERGSSL